MENKNDLVENTDLPVESEKIPIISKYKLFITTISKRKKIIFIILSILLVTTAAFLVYNQIFNTSKTEQSTYKSAYNIAPYSKDDILLHLKDKYKKDFTINKAVKNDKYHIVYSVSPTNNSELNFYIVDQMEGGYIGLGAASEPTRIMSDNYIEALMWQDLPNLKKIYTGISLKDSYDVKKLDRTDIKFRDSSQKIEISLSGYEDIENTIINIDKLYKYIKRNDKYIGNNIIFVFCIYDESYTYDNGNRPLYYSDTKLRDYTNLTSEDIKHSLIKSLLSIYRKNNSEELFNIPVDVRQQHPISSNDGEYIRMRSSMAYINDQPSTVNLKFDIGIQPDEEKLVITSGVENIIPLLTNKITILDKNDYSIKGYPKDHEIINIYKKNNKIYYLTKDNEGDTSGWIYLYSYDKNISTLIKDIYLYGLSSEEMNEYFGISFSYDYEKELVVVKI